MKKYFANLVQGVSVAVLGDFILDEYIWGKTERISPEAPVPIVKMNGTEIRLGGAANVVNNVHSLGAHVVPISVVGSQQGWKLVTKLEQMGIDVNQIVHSDEYKNSHKIRVVSNAHQMVRLDNDSDIVINETVENSLIENLKYVCGKVDCLVISDYKKGVLTPRVLRKAIQFANENDIPIIVDPKGTHYSDYKHASVITPNESELELATGIKISNGDTEQLHMAALVLIKKLCLRALILTQAENGMTIFYPDGRTNVISSHALEVYDVTGAGDTVAAALATAMAIGMNIKDASYIASEAAAVVVAKVGTAACSLPEIMTDFPKIKKINELADELTIERMKNKKIVFTNGCFDLLHTGHVKLLQKASTFGDILVVGINSDKAVSLLKGPERPMIEEHERAQLLAALNCVDYVTIFDDESPLSTITAILPDVLVKGKDYDNELVIGASEVENAGGKLVLIDLEAGKSTTNIIQKIKDSTI
jgi:D-beta-D-heptose 7-phosphate kinase/D-beta-D-heptose 1-phosphate adenosyltransferase